MIQIKKCKADKRENQSFASRGCLVVRRAPRNLHVFNTERHQICTAHSFITSTNTAVRWSLINNPKHGRNNCIKSQAVVQHQTMTTQQQKCPNKTQKSSFTTSLTVWHWRQRTISKLLVRWRQCSNLIIIPEKHQRFHSFTDALVPLKGQRSPGFYLKEGVCLLVCLYCPLLADLSLMIHSPLGLLLCKSNKWVSGSKRCSPEP